LAGVLIMTNKNDLFEDIAVALESWSKSTSDSFTNKDADVVWSDNKRAFKNLQHQLSKNEAIRGDVEQALSECLRGFAVSFLTILDGGTRLSEEGRVYLVDESGNRLGEGLHDEFVSYLIETDRL